MNKKILFCALFSGALWSAPALASDFETALENAREAWQNKDYDLAKIELRDALKALSDESGNILETTFPPAPAGWEVSAASKENLPLEGFFVKKTYSRGEQKIKAAISYDNPMIGIFNSMLLAPVLAGSGAEKIRIGRDYALLQKEDEADDEITMTYLVSGKYLIVLTGEKMEDKQILIDLMKSWDIKTIQNMEG